MLSTIDSVSGLSHYIHFFPIICHHCTNFRTIEINFQLMHHFSTKHHLSSNNAANIKHVFFFLSLRTFGIRIHFPLSPNYTDFNHWNRTDGSTKQMTSKDNCFWCCCCRRRRRLCFKIIDLGSDSIQLINSEW